MYALVLAIALAQSERAYFKVDLETNTDTTLFINGNKIEKNKWYKTEPLTEPAVVEIEVAFVCGSKVRRTVMYFDIDPGERCIFHIKIKSIPPLELWSCTFGRHERINIIECSHPPKRQIA